MEITTAAKFLIVVFLLLKEAILIASVTLNLSKLNSIKKFDVTYIILQQYSQKFPQFPASPLTSKRIRIFPVGFFGLGLWQVNRRKWKKQLLRELRERYCAPPVELPDDLAKLNDMEFCRIKVCGQFLHNEEFYIPNRLRRDEAALDTKSHFLVDVHSPVGVHVVTPFLVEGKGCGCSFFATCDLTYRILINRGWVPNELKDPKRRQRGQIEGRVEVTGVNRLHEKKPPFVFESIPYRDEYFYRDVVTMAKFHNTLPIYIEADSSSNVPGGPIGGQTNVKVSDNHTTYIITWWSLSALTAFAWLKMFFW
ncbi:SurF1 family protein [Trichinella spiralis]|uniref:SurF1 family protein n=1 Tax=Trichinella spiralis TaxID=6334 RepID=UPI0001EFC1E1|nr:SurF1 family protein [Trichinella spiralis]